MAPRQSAVLKSPRKILRGNILTQPHRVLCKSYLLRTVHYTIRGQETEEANPDAVASGSLKNTHTHTHTHTHTDTKTGHTQKKGILNKAVRGSQLRGEWELQGVACRLPKLIIWEIKPRPKT